MVISSRVGAPIDAALSTFAESPSASGSSPQEASYSQGGTNPDGGTWSKIAAYLVRRRVRITVIVFVALMLEDVVIGVKPHEVFNIRDPESIVGITLVLLGLAVRSWAAGVLHKTRELTMTGPYAVIRNPLYVGSFMIMSGFATLIDDMENLYVILGPLAGLYVLQVLHEERVLSQIYEARWRDYVSRVPRFLPRRLPDRETMFGAWRLDDWMGSREYRAFGAVLAGLVALAIWRQVR